MAGAGYHPFLFLLIALLAIVEIGFTAYFVDIYNGPGWPSTRFGSLVILFLFTACWTALFALAYMYWIFSGAVHMLASIAGSTLWLLITAILWIVPAAMFHSDYEDMTCDGAPVVSICRMIITIEAIGFTEFALCVITMIATWVWVASSRRGYRDPYYARRY